MYTIVGLGNPGDEYKDTRHNAGRMAADIAREAGVSAKFITPDTYMNKTGPYVAKHIKSKSAAGKLIVIYDELDLPLGTFKISFNRGSGGHKGLDSIIKALKTREFIRIRIGVSPATPSGKLKKPKGDEAVQKHILSNFKESEKPVLKPVFKQVLEVVKVIVDEGPEKAMNRYN